ncbi:MAG: eukaryotic-like serine/threonine-protein kinase, partial [Frankiaceae bacterium]|nr:eukaryotic-like serine/threonine-protein kinase [Frankiaceae bacterium]
PTDATIPIASVTDFDPQGGDGEHPEAVQNVIDDDPLTFWPTEGYDAGFEGAGKSGVGIVLGTGDSVTASQLTLQTNGGGWKFNVYGSDAKEAPVDPPFLADGSETGAWGDPLAADQSAAKSTTVDLTPTPSRWQLIWLTDLNGVPAAEINGAQLSS